MAHDPLASCRVEVGTAQRNRLDARWRAEDLRIPWTRLYWIRGGRAAIRVDGAEVTLRPGRLYIVPAGAPFGCRCETFLDLDWAHATFTTDGGRDAVAMLAPPAEIEPKEAHRMAELFGRLVRVFQSGAPGEALETSGALLQILGMMANASPAPPARRALDPRLRPVLAAIEARLEQPLPVADLAALAHLAPTWFSRLFAREIGMPPGQYVTARRIAAAQQWLRASDLTLAEIALQTGFADAFHLSRTFKRQTGMSPSVYRKHARSRVP
jgi:AraC-like DNA-binding protein